MASDGGILTWLSEISTGNYVAIASVVSVGLGIVLLRQLVKGGECRSKVRLDGKFVIITGANTGIGKETAKDLALRGARVMIACRDPLKAAAAADDVFKTTGKRLAVKTLDLADLRSVRQFANDINKEEPRLDILINNAGVMGGERKLTKQGYELHFATNHLGHFLLTNLLRDLLVRTAPARVVNVSALLYRWGKINFDDINAAKDYSPVPAYAQSKLANILFTQELARRLKDTGVTVNTLHPGVIDTELGRHFGSKLPWVLMLFVRPLFQLVKMLVMKTASQGAQTSIYCAVSEELEGVTGKYFSDCTETRLMPHAQDEEVAKRLWEISEEMVGLQPKEDNSVSDTNPEDPECDQVATKMESETEYDSEEVEDKPEETVAESGSRQTTV